MANSSDDPDLRRLQKLAAEKGYKLKRATHGKVHAFRVDEAVLREFLDYVKDNKIQKADAVTEALRTWLGARKRS